jgi:hypothetical protein
MSAPSSSIPAAIRDCSSAPVQPRVCIPKDFADLEPRTAVDQALHRLVASRNLRRIVRGFYDTPRIASISCSQGSDIRSSAYGHLCRD